jgi:hypothetical protein
MSVIKREIERIKGQLAVILGVLLDGVREIYILLN